MNTNDTINRNKERVLVLGIDGGTFDIILPMIKSGKLPNIERLYNKSAHSTLLSTIPPVTAPAWSSFMTGSNPGKHGVYYFFKEENKIKTALSQKVLINLRDIEGIHFWNVLNHSEKKVGLINIPLTYPPEPVNGFMISGMLVPPGSSDYTHPPELVQKLDNYHVDIDDLMKQGEWQGKKLIKEGRETFIQNVFQMTKTRTLNALKLMKDEPWDFFMIVFTGSDRICHFFWEDLESGKAPSDIVEDYYVLLDSMIGKLCKEAGDDVCKIVLSDHGFGPAPGKKINVYKLAKQLGETTFHNGHVLSYLKARIMSKIGRPKPLSLDDMVDVNKSNVLFEPLYANFLGIRINHKNMENFSDSRYQILKEKIINYCRSLIDPILGKPLIEKVHTRESLYHGKFTENSPDIVVQFKYDYSIEFSPLKRAIVRKNKNVIRTGDHRREGIFMVSGKDIQPGKLERELFIQDVTPTMLYLAGCPIPKCYDGRFMEELFNKAYLTQKAPEYIDESMILKKSRIKDSEQDAEKEIEQAKSLLKNLGYM